MDEKERYEAGKQVRRAVLGDAHVDRSLITIAMLIGMNREGGLCLILLHCWAGGDGFKSLGAQRSRRAQRYFQSQLLQAQRRALC